MHCSRNKLTTKLLIKTDIFRYCNVTAPTGRNRQVRSHLRLTEDQKADVRTFRAFNNEIANGHCTLCMRVLYPEEQHYRSLTQEWIICDSWNNINPIVHADGKATASQEEAAATSQKMRDQFVYPGTLSTGRIGHYEVKGHIFTNHNYEHAEMAYGGVLGLFFQKGDIAGVNKQKVKDAYSALQATHPLLARYRLQNLTYSLVNYHVKHNRDYIAAGHNFADLIIGTDAVKNSSVRYGHPSLLALLFPFLYTNCTGHYSMSSVTPELEGLKEQHGGVSRCTLSKMTLADYAKSRLLMRDRRFGKDPSHLGIFE
ncbi:hypothetical protein BD770DRAFT_477951 [Pilaira anomala]|nr:hypothetical protein BD770DRAFT_477951 [Pilaira anomala]